MSKEKSVKKETQTKPQFIINAIVVPHSRLELYTSIKNIISFYQQSLLDLITGDSPSDHNDNILRCDEALRKLFQEHRSLLSNDIALLINEFFSESEVVYKLCAKRKTKAHLLPKQRALLQSKQSTLDFIVTSIENMIAASLDGKQ